MCVVSVGRQGSMFLWVGVMGLSTAFRTGYGFGWGYGGRVSLWEDGCYEGFKSVMHSRIERMNYSTP